MASSSSSSVMWKRLADLVVRPIRRRIGIPYVRRADAARARGDWIEALVDYRRGLEWLPWRDDLRIQVGNCLKEFGDYRGAVRVYSAVKNGSERPEAQKQIADASRRAGILILPYAIAERSGDLSVSANGSPDLPPLSAKQFPNRIKLDKVEPRRWLGTLGYTDVRAIRAKGNNFPSITFDQVGNISLEREGALEPLLAGIVAIRARIVSQKTLVSIELWLGEDDAARHVATVATRPVEHGIHLLKYCVVNAWIDAATLPLGRQWLSLRGGPGVPAAGLFVTVADAPSLGEELQASNAFVASPRRGADPEATIISAPAVVRPAARSVFGEVIRHIVVMRVDQLGDVCASLPALLRLRALFPEARITMVVQPGVKGIVEASALVDDVITLTLGYNAASERRYLDVDEEIRARAQFLTLQIDLAIDLNPGDETRPLLLLTQATYLAGFNADRFTFLDFGIGVRSRDKVNQIGAVSHTATVLMLVEAIALAVARDRDAVPRVASSEATLRAHGLVAGAYVVLHAGARHLLNCWPRERFVELADRLSETGYDVVLFVDGAITSADMAPGEAKSGRVQQIATVDGDAFDAIVSNARLLVGNDSGPKHLAATRGVPTVSIHVDRLNWAEWGQDSRGVIISKRVPCTGCGLNDLQLCGRDAVCVKSIAVDDVVNAVQPYL